jgi:hypothetical protein
LRTLDIGAWAKERDLAALSVEVAALRADVSRLLVLVEGLK